MGSTQTFNMKALEGTCGSSENDRRVTHGISSKKAERQVGPGRWEHPSGYGQVGVVAGGVSSDCAVTPGQVPRRAAPPPRWRPCLQTLIPACQSEAVSFSGKQQGWLSGSGPLDILAQEGP